MSTSRRIEVNPDWCKGCNVCVAFCPKQVLALDERGKAYVANIDACIWCRECELRCPDLAVTVVVERAS